MNFYISDIKVRIDDEELLLEIIKKRPMIIKKASTRLRNDKEFILKALNTNTLVFAHLNYKFRNNKKIALNAIKKYAFLLENVGCKLQHDIDLLRAFRDNGNYQHSGNIDSFDFINEMLNRLIVLECKKVNGYVFIIK